MEQSGSEGQLGKEQRLEHWFPTLYVSFEFSGVLLTRLIPELHLWKC